MNSFFASKYLYSFLSWGFDILHIVNCITMFQLPNLICIDHKFKGNYKLFITVITVLWCNVIMNVKKELNRFMYVFRLFVL